MVNVVHVITDLKVGGAQVMLHKLLSHVDRSEFRSSVISISSGGGLVDSFRSVSDVASVDFDRRGLPLMPLLRLARLLRERRPDVVQTWMYHADLLGGVAARLATSAPVLWNIRSSALGDSKRSMRVALRLLAAMSRAVPFEIVSCSVRARDVLIDIGYDRGRFVVIPNGFDVDAFQPRPEARDEVRRELGIPPEARLLGLVARWHPMKDHAMFIRAATRIAAAQDDVFFLLCGDDIDSDNAALCSIVAATGIADRFRLLGRRADVPRLTAALDIACSSSSILEGFSNAVGEAMACAVPCVATDVGDSAFLIADTGRVVAPGDDAAFAAQCLSLLSLSPEVRMRLGMSARARIEKHFEIGVVTRMYEELYRRAARRERFP